MSVFFAGAALLAVLTVVLLWHGRDREPRAADRDDPNLDWFRQRAGELRSADGVAGDAPHQDSAVDTLNDTLEKEARLRLVEDGVGAVAVTGDGAADPGAATPRPGAEGRSPGPWLIVPVLLLAAGLYWQLGAFPDVLIYRDLAALEAGDEDALTGLAERIATRSAQRPENAQYLGLLGQLQVADEDFASAATTYAQLAALAPQSAEAQAQAAQSRFLAAGRVLDEQALRYAQQALAINPQQGMALGLLGMAAFEAGLFDESIRYWRRLQTLEVQGSPGYEMLDDVIAIAQARATGGSVGNEADISAAPGAVAEPGITVTVSAPSENGGVAANAIVYVFARDPAAGSRMPIAVRRLQANELPLTLRLSDADSMAGQRLSEAGEVVITAQLSRNGQPGRDNAAFIGSAPAIAAGDEDVAVTVELDRVNEGP